VAAEIRKRFPDAEVKLIPSPKGGRFLVLREGIAVFDKSEAGRHANPGEVISLLEKKS
jgi:hypothetical protein